MTTITIPRETFDQMQRALELLLDRSMCMMTDITSATEQSIAEWETAESALSAAKAVGESAAVVHESDCALHNEPAYPAGPCDCSLSKPMKPSRIAFEHHWVKTRGGKKSRNELQRHHKQPDTYVADSANRHWVTWQAAQAAAKAVQPQAQEGST